MVTKRRRPKAVAPRQPADDRRARFVDEYLIDLNATRAAKAAGYSPESAYSQGSRLLKDAKVKGEIERRQKAAADKAAKRYEITADRIQREQALLAFSNPMDFGRIDGEGHFVFDMSATTRDEAAALHSFKTKRTRRTRGKGDDAEVIEDVETSFRLADKRASLEGLAKMIGMYRDGPDITIPVTFVVERTARSKRQEQA